MAKGQDLTASHYWEFHTKKNRTHAGFIMSYLVSRDSCRTDRERKRRDFGTTTSDWTWQSSPKLSKSDPGHLSTVLSRSLSTLHPAYTKASSTRPTVKAKMARSLTTSLVESRKKLSGDLLSSFASAPDVAPPPEAKEAETAEGDEVQGRAIIPPEDYELYQERYPLRSEFWKNELDRMMAEGHISSEDYEVLASDLRWFELEHILDIGFITKNDHESLKWDLRSHELSLMKKKGFISLDDYRALKDDLRKYEMNDLLEKELISRSDFEKLESDLSKLELQLMMRRGILPKAEYDELLSNLRRHLISRMMRQGIISAADLELLLNDLRRFEVDHFLEAGIISAADHEALRSELRSFELARMKNNGFISEADFEMLKTAADQISKPAVSSTNVPATEAAESVNVAEDVPAKDVAAIASASPAADPAGDAPIQEVLPEDVADKGVLTKEMSAMPAASAEQSQSAKRRARKKKSIAAARDAASCLSSLPEDEAVPKSAPSQPEELKKETSAAEVSKKDTSALEVSKTDASALEVSERKEEGSISVADDKVPNDDLSNAEHSNIVGA